jgi:hypothetical protein
LPRKFFLRSLRLQQKIAQPAEALGGLWIAEGFAQSHPLLAKLGSIDVESLEAYPQPPDLGAIDRLVFAG